MTNIIIAVDKETYIHTHCEKSPDEIRREIELGAFPFPVAMIDPTAVRLQNYLLIAEREARPMLSHKQKEVLELLSYGASETEIGRSMNLTHSGVRYHVEKLKELFHVSTREELITVYCNYYR